MFSGFGFTRTCPGPGWSPVATSGWPRTSGYGDVYVDRARSREVYRQWLAMTRPALGPDGQRRPEFLMRPVKPARRAFRVPEDTAGGGRPEDRP